jgi:hypothetical protein
MTCLTNIFSLERVQTFFYQNLAEKYVPMFRDDDTCRLWNFNFNFWSKFDECFFVVLDFDKFELRRFSSGQFDYQKFNVQIPVQKFSINFQSRRKSFWENSTKSFDGKIDKSIY